MFEGLNYTLYNKNTKSYLKDVVYGHDDPGFVFTKNVNEIWWDDFETIESNHQLIGCPPYIVIVKRREV